MEKEKTRHPLRVVQLLGAGEAGGAETFFVRLVAAFAKRSAEIEILPVVRRGSWAAARLEAMGIRHEVARFGGWWDVGTRLRVRRMVKDFAPDVVMAWMNRATRFVPCGPWVRVARLGGYYKIKYYTNNVDYLIGNTEDLCRYLREFWPAEKVMEVGNFIPRPAAGWRRQRAAVRQRLGIATADRVLLMAARLHPVKGWDVALRMLAALPQDVVLLALGDGGNKEVLRGLAQDLGVEKRVKWVGWADDVTPYAAAADVWLVASSHEPLGNSVLDAWAHGLPVVSTRSQGPLQLINDGESGLLVDVGDTAALGDAAMRVLEDGALRARLVAGGTARFEEDFAEEVIVRRFLDVYRAMMDDNRKEKRHGDV